MKPFFLVALAILVITGCASSTPQRSMQEDVDQASSIIQRFQNMPETAIPPVVMKNAVGLAILTVTKAGFIGSVRGGSGIVIARTGKGWSGPIAVGAGGVGFGFQAGAEVSEYVIVLNTPAAVDAFANNSSVTLGGNVSVAAGPVGRAAEGNIGIKSATYTYSHSQGLFAGVFLEGTVIRKRDDLNAAYYGKPVEAGDVLAGKFRPPAGANKLITLLDKSPMRQVR